MKDKRIHELVLLDSIGIDNRELQDLKDYPIKENEENDIKAAKMTMKRRSLLSDLEPALACVDGDMLRTLEQHVDAVRELFPDVFDVFEHETQFESEVA